MPKAAKVLAALAGFSALQRAENSSIGGGGVLGRGGRTFQCSSASRKFLNRRTVKYSSTSTTVSVLFSEPKIPQSSPARHSHSTRLSFSALQRAENSSMSSRRSPARREDLFQCSSASRKFLNQPYRDLAAVCLRVSVLFSEPKIPQ